MALTRQTLIDRREAIYTALAALNVPNTTEGGTSFDVVGLRASYMQELEQIALDLQRLDAGRVHTRYRRAQ